MSPTSAQPPSSPGPDPLSGAVVLLAGLVAAVVVAAVGLLLLGGDTDDEAAIGDRAIERSIDVDADPDAPSTVATTGADSEPDGAETEAEATGQGRGSTPTTVAGTATGAVTTARNTTDTVEADETTDDTTDRDAVVDDGDGGEQAGGDTVPTVPPPTTGTCRIAIGRLDGRSGDIDLGRDGACGALAATVQGVNPRDDLAGIDWGRDIRVCQRHPAAAEVAVAVTTGAKTVQLTAGYSRTAAEATANPVQTITITFDDQDTPLTSPRPVALCRTDDAEVSIVHRPPA